MSPYRPLASYPVAGAVPGYAPASAAPGFQFADLIRLAHARRGLILRITLAVVVLAAMAAYSMPTTWSTASVVMLDPRKNNITDISAILSQLPTDPSGLQNQIQILDSRELSGMVVDRLHLVDDPEFNSKLAKPGMGQLLDPRSWFASDATVANPAQDRDRVIDAFRNHVSADSQGLSSAVTITVTSGNPAKAALLANTLADVYVKQQVATKISAGTATTGWLDTRLHDLAQQLQAQEEAIQRYKAQHGLNDSDSTPGGSLIDQQMVGISAQVVQARSDLAEKQAIQNRIAQLEASGNIADVSQIVSSPLIVALRTQQGTLLAEEGTLTSKYGPLHPKMQAIQQQKRDLEMKIGQEVSRLAASAANDVMVAQAHLSSLQGSLGGTEHTAMTQNMARVQLQALQSNANSTRTMYEAFVQRLRQSQNQDEAQTPDSRIISEAPVPLMPSGPKRSLIIGASLPLGLLLGLLAALLVEKLGPMLPVRVNGAPRAALMQMPAPAAKAQRAPRRPVQPPVAVWNGPPILSEINDSAALRAADFVIDYPASKFSHALAALVRQLEVRPEAAMDGAAVVAVTSANFGTDPGENRSAIAVSLARAASKMGKKTIILDCAPGGQSSRAIKAPVTAGLYEVLTGAVPLNQALAKDPRGEVFLLGTSRRPPNALTMFTSHQMARLVTILRGGADFVVIDCGAAGTGAEAALLARLADATVLVARRQALHAPSLANATQILASAHAAPVGIVLTK